MKSDKYEREPSDTKTSDLLLNNVDILLNCNTFPDQDEAYKEVFDVESEDKFFEDSKPNCNDQNYLIRFKNAAFSWKMRDNTWLDIDDLDIPVGEHTQFV